VPEEKGGPAEAPPHGMLQNKEALNTDLEMLGVGAMFRFHNHHNTLDRIIHPAVGFGEGVQKPPAP
jgi:hypothetical protein